MTYRELMEAIQKMSEEQKDMTATVYLSNIEECLPVASIRETCETESILDVGHPIMEVN